MCGMPGKECRIFPQRKQTNRLRERKSVFFLFTLYHASEKNETRALSAGT
jgi:hypothetical protein